MTPCTKCTLYYQGCCRLKFKDPETGERITEPLSAYLARSYQWACGCSGSFASTVSAPLYEKLFGTFTEEEIDHKPYPHEE